MNYLSGALRYVARGDAEPQNVVPRLVDRIKTSALPHDRRAAIVQLTDAAKESPNRQAQIGEMALKVLYAVLEQDSDYDDTVKATFELLIVLCGVLDTPAALSQSPGDSASRDQFLKQSREAASTNIDVFLGLPNALPIILQLLEKQDFYVRFGAVELLAAMAANSRQTLQAAILEAPQGVTRVSDLLDDSHRHIRSNSVLLLSSLCDGSSEICKIVVFGGVLERLFSLAESFLSVSSQQFDQPDADEDNTLEDSIVVQDVLLAIRTLVNGAASTKTFFHDSGCVPRLVSVLERSASDASFALPDPGKVSPVTQSSGFRFAIEQQARANLFVALQSIVGLVSSADDESRVIKNDLSSTNILKTLATIAFAATSDDTNDANKPPKKVLPLRIYAFRSFSKLVRGHNGFRSVFSSSPISLMGNVSTTNLQVASLRTMLTDSSAAARLAAYSTLRESFVIDAGLDLPSSALLNALTSSGGAGTYALADNRNLSHGSLSSSSDVGSSSDNIAYIAEALKEALVGWPNEADASGVFYAASFLSWMLPKVEDARGRLLGCFVNGTSLLPQVMRIIGKIEREKGPPEVRISLFSLICVWLSDCSSAVSTFLSSAMHLPLLVDILRSEPTRGDVADVHVRGLAAVVLGICLQATDMPSDPLSDGGFIGGGRGASVVVSRDAVTDVIRSRIGVTVFTSCLDDLRATPAFSVEVIPDSEWKLAETLSRQEENDGYFAGKGSLGHEFWYEPALIAVVNNIYTDIGAKALDLLSHPKLQADSNSAHKGANGYSATGKFTSGDARKGIEDSARDEVLQSYKEFIRSQDETLNTARLQIDELSAALREAQAELDSKGSDLKESDAFGLLKKERDDLYSQKEALEVLLDEKTSDFEAVSNALASLEEDQSSRANGISGVENRADIEETHTLRTQYDVVSQSLESEMQKNMELSQRLAMLGNAVRKKDAEIGALSNECDSLRTNVLPEVSESLNWRSRAEIAEASLQSRDAAFQGLQSTVDDLQGRINSSEQARELVQSKANFLQQSLSETQAELDSIRAARSRELQISRDSSATNAAAAHEIEELRSQLLEAQSKISEQATSVDVSSSDNSEILRLREQRDSALRAAEGLRTELHDLNQVSNQWKKRAEAHDATVKQQHEDKSKLLTACREHESTIKSLKQALASESQTSIAIKNRLSEVEHQCSELEEVRLRSEEEFSELRRDLDSRTELSIRLSGQLYELEESKGKLEQEIQDLLRKQTSHDASLGVRDMASSSTSEEIESLRKELMDTKDALAESLDKENLSRAQAQDRDSMVEKVEALETALGHAESQLQKMEHEANDMKERLMFLDEAEDAKRALTMQVVNLQKALSVQEQSSPRESSAKMDEQISDLQQRNGVLESKLVNSDEVLKEARQKITSFETEQSVAEKKVSDVEASLSAARRDMDEKEEEVKRLNSRLEEFVSFKRDAERLVECQKELNDSKLACENLSSELSSLTASHDSRKAELERLRQDSQNLAKVQQELDVVRKKYDEQGEELEDVKNQVSSEREALKRITEFLEESEQEVDAAEMRAVQLRGELKVMEFSLDTVRAEKDEATNRVELLTQSCQELESTRARNDELSVELDKLKSSVETFELVKEEAKKNAEVLEEKSRLLDVATSQLDQLKSEVSLLKASNEASESQSIALRKDSKRFVESQRELQEARSKCDELSAEVSSLSSHIAAHSSEMESVKQDSRRLEESRLALKCECEDLKGKITSLHAAQEIQEAVHHAALEGNRLTSKERQQRLEEADKRVAKLLLELDSAAEAYREISNERDILQAANESLEKKICTAREQLEIVQRTNLESSTIFYAGSVMSEIANNVSCATTAFSSSITLGKAAHERDAALLTSSELNKKLVSQGKDLESMRSIRNERDNLAAICEEQKSRLSQLCGEVAGLKEIAAEHSEMKLSLQDAKKSIDHLTGERDSLESSKASCERSSDAPMMNEEGQTLNKKLQVRISALEDALRDAARTVNLTNKELISTQSLLVELSSDKTAMRTELSFAEKQIVELTKQLCTTSGEGNGGIQTETRAMSDISEIDPPTSNVVDPDVDAAVSSDLMSEELKAAHLEVGNLTVVLDRTVSEADSAASLMARIFEKMSVIEDRVQRSRSDVEATRANETRLGSELENTKQLVEEERAVFIERNASLEQQISDLRTRHQSEIDEHTRMSSSEMDNIREKLVVCKEQNFQAQEENERLKNKFDEAITSWLEEKNKLSVQYEKERAALEEALSSQIAKLRVEVDDVRRDRENVKAENLDLEMQSRNDSKKWSEEKSHIVHAHQKELENVKASSSAVEESLHREVKNRERDIVGLEEKNRKLLEDLSVNSAGLTQANEQIAGLENSLEVVLRRAERGEEKAKNTEQMLSDATEREDDLKRRIAFCEALQKEMEVSHREAMEVSQRKWEKEVREYEEEIDRCGTILEERERQLRDSDNSKKSEVKSLGDRNDELLRLLEESKVSVEKYIAKLEESICREAEMEKDLARSKEKHRDFVKDADEVRKALEADVMKLEGANDRIEEELTKCKTKLGKQLKGAEEQLLKIKLLEEENQEFVNHIEWLEQRCKRAQDEAKAKQEAYDELSVVKSNLERSFKEESDSCRRLEGKLSETERRVRDLRFGKINAEKENESISGKLREKEAQCETWARDNEDLREWVKDLERQAVELQTAASDFEEVEQSLQDTLESQRQNAEAINKLNEELRERQEALRQAEGRERKIGRSLKAVEQAKRHSEQRASEAEKRLAGIRESNVVKLGASEAAVRTQAARCAELETLVAEAQRQVAELSISADEAFSAKAEVRRLREDIERVSGRCEDAEGKVEELENELRMAKEEIEEVKEGTSGEAMRALEAEHNELLVYLADLEMELTSLKEESAADHQSP